MRPLRPEFFFKYTLSNGAIRCAFVTKYFNCSFSFSFVIKPSVIFARHYTVLHLNMESKWVHPLRCEVKNNLQCFHACLYCTRSGVFRRDDVGHTSDGRFCFLKAELCNLVKAFSVNFRNFHNQLHIVCFFPKLMLLFWVPLSNLY